ncbi:hypothetical protein C8R46DRAFT_424651 [Mycena filopes]|nr:hypothetical protein C8R46DRAFT_424651 [Mycena filopes]
MAAIAKRTWEGYPELPYSSGALGLPAVCMGGPRHAHFRLSPTDLKFQPALQFCQSGSPMWCAGPPSIATTVWNGLACLHNVFPLLLRLGFSTQNRAKAKARSIQRDKFYPGTETDKRAQRTDAKTVNPRSWSRAYHLAWSSGVLLTAQTLVGATISSFRVSHQPASMRRSGAGPAASNPSDSNSGLSERRSCSRNCVGLFK